MIGIRSATYFPPFSGHCYAHTPFSLSHLLMFIRLCQSKTSPYWTFIICSLQIYHCRCVPQYWSPHQKKLRIHKIHMRTAFMCVVGACHICQGSMSSPSPIVFYFGQTGVGGCINCNVCGPEIPTGISKELRGLGWQPCGDRNQQLQRHRPPLIPSLQGSIFALTASGIKWKRRQGPERSAVKAQEARRHNESCVQERDAVSKTWTIKPLGNRLLNSCTLCFMGPTLIHLCIRFYINKLCVPGQKKNNWKTLTFLCINTSV